MLDDAGHAGVVCLRPLQTHHDALDLVLEAADRHVGGLDEQHDRLPRAQVREPLGIIDVDEQHVVHEIASEAIRLPDVAEVQDVRQPAPGRDVGAGELGRERQIAAPQVILGVGLLVGVR